MAGDRPKVLYEVADRPMIWWVIQACREAGVARCVVVVGHKGDQVRQALHHSNGCVFVEQGEQLGTGHAALMAEPAFADVAPCDVMILNGDGPLIRARTIQRILQTHRQAGAVQTLATSVLDNPFGYGRIIRDADGQLEEIVEENDCSPKQKGIQEINPNYVCVRSDLLFDALQQLGQDNAQREYLLTDVPKVLRNSGHCVAVVPAVPPEDVFGINTPQELAHVDQILRQRLAGEGQLASANGKAS